MPSLADSSSPRYDTSVTVWAKRIRSTLLELVRDRRSIQIADDVAQDGVERFLRNPARYMFEFDSPEHAARAMVRNLVRNHQRAERGDRGQGVEWAVDADGHRHPRREVDSFEQLLEELGYEPRLAGRSCSSLGSDVVNRKHMRQLVNRMFALLGPADAELMRLVYLDDADPTAVARRLAITPEALRQRLHRARGRCQGILRRIDGDGGDRRSEPVEG